MRPNYEKYLGPVIGIGFMIVVGIWLLAFGWTSVRTNQLLDQNSDVVEGRVLSSESRKLSRGGQSYTIVVEYKPEGHAAVTREFDVGGTDFTQAREKGVARVTYFPSKPSISRVTRFEDMPLKIITVLGGLMLAAGLFCIGYHWKNGLNATPGPQRA